MKSLLILVMAAGFWFAALDFMSTVFSRLQGMEGDIGVIIALKGLSLLLMMVFFLLIFSSLLSGIGNFFLSKDLTVILSSPVSWGSIYFSKWLETAVKSSWMIVFAILPVLLSFGWLFKAPVGYYLSLLPVMIMFILVPVGIGIMLSIILMAVVPARRAKNIFLILGILVMAILFLLFRLMRPERFANPEWFANLAIFIAEMKLPVSVFLPSTWAAETFTPFFNTRGGAPVFYMLLLLFTAGAFIVFGGWLFNALYYNGLVKAQQSHRPGMASFKALKTTSVFFRGAGRALADKDLITFFRSVGQWSQMLLLFAIIIIYLFSIKALPVEWGTYLSLQLKYMISFLNIGVVAFVITAIASRLVLPSVDSEGRSFWIIRVSPVSMQRFLWNKYLLSFVPLLLLGQLLIIVSNMFLGVKTWFMFLGAGTCLVLVSSITGLAVGIGAYNARFQPEDANREQSGIQGAVYMLAAFAIIAVTVILEIVPVTGIFVKEVSDASLTSRGWTIIGISFLAVLVLNFIALLGAMKLGEKRLAAME